MGRWRVILVLLVLILVIGQPVLTAGGRNDQVYVGQDRKLGAGQELEGDLVVFGGDIELEPGSRVRGSVLALGGSVTVAGRVDGRAMAPSGRVELERTAVVNGGILAASAVTRPAGAVVRGLVTDNLNGGFSSTLFYSYPGRCPLGFPGFWFGWPWGVGLAGDLTVSLIQVLLGSIVAVGVGLLVALLAPRPTRTAGEALSQHPWHSVWAGVGAWALAVLVVTPLLVGTCIGIPIAVAGLVGLTVAALFGFIITGYVVGERALLALGLSSRRPLPAVAVGLALLAVLISVPYLGMLAVALIGIWGMGAVVLTRFGTQPFRTRPPRVTPRRR